MKKIFSYLIGGIAYLTVAALAIVCVASMIGYIKYGIILLFR